MLIMSIEKTSDSSWFSFEYTHLSRRMDASMNATPQGVEELLWALGEPPGQQRAARQG